MKHRTTRPFVLGMPLLFGALLLASLIALFSSGRTEDQRARRAHAATNARTLGEEVGASLVAGTSRLEHLGLRMAATGLDEAAMRRELQDVLQRHPALESVTWSDVEHVARWAEPPAAEPWPSGAPLVDDAGRAARAAAAGQAPAWSTVRRPDGTAAVDVFVGVTTEGRLLGTLAGRFSADALLAEHLGPHGDRRYEAALLAGDGAVLGRSGGGGDADLAGVAAVPIEGPQLRVRVAPVSRGPDARLALGLAAGLLTLAMTGALLQRDRAVERLRRTAEALEASEQEVARELEASTVLGELARDLAGTVQLPEAARRVAEAARALTKSPVALLAHVDASTGTLVASVPGEPDPSDSHAADFRGGDGRRRLSVTAQSGERVVGSVTVAGADADYDDRDLQRLQRIADLFATVVERAWAHDALLASERRWRRILDQAADPIFLHDGQGRLVEVNRRACESLRTPREKLIGRTVIDVDPDLSIEGIRDLWPRVLAGEQHTVRGTHRRRDGTAFPVEVNLGCVGREPDLIMAVARDITVHRRTEELLDAIARGLAHTGEDFFRTLVALLGRLVPGADLVLASELAEGGTSLRAIAMQVDGTPAADFGYVLAGTPCALAVRDGHFVQADGVAEGFPGDGNLARMGARAYVGFALRDAAGAPIGVLAMLSRQPLADERLTVSLMEIFAARAGAELERLRAEAAVRRERSFLQQVIDGVPESILVIGADHRILLMNDAARAGAAPRSFSADARCHAVTRGRDTPCDPAQCPLHEALRSGAPQTFLHEHLDHEGKLRFVEVEATPLRDPEGGVLGVIETARDVTERKRAEDELREHSRELSFQATHDRLTSLPNRALLMERLRQALAKARRNDTGIALLFVDLDRFKAVNDQLGHETGDTVLEVLGRRLRASVRENDTVARIGGDEFVVLLEGLADDGPAVAVARKLIGTISQPIEVGAHELQVGASVGIALFPGDGADEETLLRNADAAMYRAKEQGGGAFRHHASAREACRR